MKLDISKLVQSPFEDGSWMTKIAIGTVLQLLSILIVPYLAFTGYYLKTIKTTAEGEGEDKTLPEWDDWGGLISSGFMFNLGLFVWLSVPLGLMIFGGGSMIMSLVGGLAQGGKSGAAMGIAGGGIATICLLAGSALLMIISLIIPMLSIRFAMTGSLGSMFEVGPAIKDIMTAPVDYLIILIAPTVFGFVFSFLTGITGGLASILALPVSVLVAVIMARMQGALQRDCLN